jgi:glycosyltransferase involved in cell wall biosynthesis
VAVRADAGTGAPAPRVLHVLAPAPVGGLERVVQTLSFGLLRAGHDVHVAALVDVAERDHPFVAETAAGGVAVHAVAVPQRAYRRERAMVRELCRRIQPAVVHLHGYRADVLQAGVAGRLRIPRVTTVHGFTGGDARNRLYETLQRISFRRMEAVVAVSRPLAERLAAAGIAPDRLHLVRNAWEPTKALLDPVEARARLGASAGLPHVAFVGRLGAEKGADVFVEALGLLHDRLFVASVIGDGREMGALRQRAAELGLADRLHWHGLVPEAGRLFRGFDVFVLSSRTEGTPIALMEAISAGVPVVATRVGGVPDMVSDQEAALVEPERPDALASAIRRVLDDPDGARARAERARTRMARENGVDAWIERYREVYASAMSVAAGRGRA